MSERICTTTRLNKRYWSTKGTEKAFLLVELNGNGTARMASRSPMNISLVLDRSGSMEGAPLAFSKKACRFVTEQLKDHDLLSLVVFDNEVQTIIPPQKVVNKDGLKTKIEAISTGGSTNLSGGLLQGIQHVKQGKELGSVNRVILLSDGHANEGITDAARLHSIAKEFVRLGIGITAMGAGDGFDEELMEGIAEHGGGNFYFIAKPEEIPGIFSKELEGLLSVIVQNLHLTMKPSENVSIERIYGYQADPAEQGMQLILGDVFEGETKSILIELSFGSHLEGKHKILDLQWEYADVSEGVQLCAIQHSIEVDFTSDIYLLMHQEVDPYVEKQIKITETALAIEDAIVAFDRGDEQMGLKLLQHQADTMLCAAIQSEDAELREEAQQLYHQLENFSFTSHTRKSLHEQKYRQMKRKR
ncbi:vWA domain-containing protein [Paenibacillus arenilitoris]|uniref:VWA domain-containing protein n=1 Tax=Paenibacillus arenilitoris TaxID=2772299 RepID=A0A927HAF2_9BACL|nr:VWA domain-containing protein [Paenibacillus arenilitoris]MBD2872554.1 VWA domain-containing protein [Paenibacillus arenilitoris]